jgi:tetratricopeptide (TPR) repeat protein
MDFQDILKQIHEYYDTGHADKAHDLMLQKIEQATTEHDDACLLQLLNEILGYYRETSQTEAARETAVRAIEQANSMGLTGTMPYATTLLNAATAYRAMGELELAEATYREVAAIYEKILPEHDMYRASLANNLSLLYQETGDFAKAYTCQKHALRITKKAGATFELAVTYANLSATCVQMEKWTEAKCYATKAIALFGEMQVKDAHYSAALASLGAYSRHIDRPAQAAAYYEEAMHIIENNLGKNEAWHRIAAHHAAVSTLERETKNGMGLARLYYTTYVRPMIAEQFRAYEDRIAVGLVGRGSDCFGFDDTASKDHDWGPDLCLWLDDATYAEIGDALQEAYEALPDTVAGYARAKRVNAGRRRGVLRISDFYKDLIGTDTYETIDWANTPDYALAAAINGEVFSDAQGTFTRIREALLLGYPERIRRLKMAECMSKYAQNLQYNFSRMWNRGETIAARIHACDGMREAIKLYYLIHNRYAPHDKWLHRGIETLPDAEEFLTHLGDIEAALAKLPLYPAQTSRSSVTTGATPAQTLNATPALVLEKAADELGEYFARKLYALDIISDIDPYLDAHRDEMRYKADLAETSTETLALEIAKLEFAAFDKVQNEGGRASCQNDWPTFRIMRMSQYLTWDRTMLLQYLYDFNRELALGHNLIEEKYGRMMASTAPEQYEKIKAHFPALSDEKKAIIEQICALQVEWMETFAKEYPALADNARSIRTTQDNPFNTSYETYLRGELGTYSDKMLELYARHIVSYAKTGKNPARDIMENSVRMYGYNTLEEAEQKTAAAWN